MLHRKPRNHRIGSINWLLIQVAPKGPNRHPLLNRKYRIVDALQDNVAILCLKRESERLPGRINAVAGI
jgi:hypothetical protein